MAKTLCISFRDDELNRIAELMEQHSLSRHGVVKLAVRRSLFPHEKTVPLGEKKLSYTVEPEKKETPNKTSSNPPFLWEEEDPFP